MTRRAPWESVSPEEQLFVLITGANSGVGLALAQRLIDEFLASRPRSSHLILLPTTRSRQKCRAVALAVRAYARSAALSRFPSDPRAASSRIHVLSLPLDLCDLADIYAFADRLCREPVSNPPADDEALVDVRIPRIDVAVFNAAYGGWSGFSIPRLLWAAATKGPTDALSWPTYKTRLPPCILNEDRKYGYPTKPLLGEVFTACLFGHYVLAHQLLPLLTRRADSATLGPGRIVWSGSIDALAMHYKPSDPQCLEPRNAYESTKRMMEIMSLTASLPSVQPIARRFFRPDNADGAELESDTKPDRVPPVMYLSHPGVVVTALFPVPWFLMWAYHLGLALVRWLGSPWHNPNAYVAAVSACWLTLAGQDALDAAHAHRVKWGSANCPNEKAFAKATEIEGWGWEGRPETDQTIMADTAPGLRNKRRGRRAGAPPVTSEDIQGFEESGVQVWAELERLRCQWDVILHSSDSD